MVRAKHRVAQVQNLHCSSAMPSVFQHDVIHSKQFYTRAVPEVHGDDILKFGD